MRIKLITASLLISMTTIVAPAMAQMTGTVGTGASAPAATGPDTVCLGAAADALTQSLSSAMGAYAAAMTTAYSARSTAWRTAWTKNNIKERRTAVRVADKKFATDSQAARKQMNQARAAAWKQYGAAHKACRSSSLAPTPVQASE